MMKKKRNLTRDKIKACALALANEVGIQNLSFPKIAERLDIKYPSLYNHYQNIEELQADMATTLYQRLNDELMRTLIGKSKGEAVMAYALVYKEFVLNYHGAYDLLTLLHRFDNEELSHSVLEHGAILRQILGSFGFSEQTIINKSRALRSMVHGYLSLSMLGFLQHDKKVNPDESYRVMIADFIRLCDQHSEE
ncbi:MAG: WHG domain-containing protein [Sporolactobacillus sp.]